MGKDKLRRFRENLTFECFVQPEFDEVFHRDHPLKGNWNRDFFRNDNPIVLELGCANGLLRRYYKNSVAGMVAALVQDEALTGSELAELKELLRKAGEPGAE